MSNIASLARAAEADARPTVIALHCSGATRSEWRQLERDLGHRFTLIAPDLIGSGAAAHWAGSHAFNLSNEAARVVRIIDEAEGPVHLVGHSYGGCVALRAAIERPSRVASMALYEPAAFHVLKMMGPKGRLALEEITAVAGYINRFVLNGDYHAAAEYFFECWNGEGSWAAMRREVRDELVRYIPKVCLEFSAEFGERLPLVAYRRFYFPVLLLQGEHAPKSTQLIARQLARAVRFASLQTVYGAGHMGPLTHASAVSTTITEWIVRAQPRLRPLECDIELDTHQAA